MAATGVLAVADFASVAGFLPAADCALADCFEPAADAPEASGDVPVVAACFSRAAAFGDAREAESAAEREAADFEPAVAGFGPVAVDFE